MRTACTFLMTFALSWPTIASAWDTPAMWNAPADAAQPGGGGIYATGGGRDFRIVCSHCHITPANRINLSMDFAPALAAGNAYRPGQQYQVTANLAGEYLGMSGCGQYMSNVNEFAASFEDAAGQTAGILASDAGQSAAACPTQAPTAPFSGTTALYGDCHAVISNGKPNETRWQFSWTAPAAGTGPVTLYYGGVDGNCDMSSLNDDVKTGTMSLGEATAAKLPTRSGRTMLAMLGSLPILGLAAALGNRRRKRAR
jgi:hypothetical protein